MNIMAKENQRINSRNVGLSNIGYTFNPVAGSRQRVEIFSAIRMPKKYYPTLTRLPSDILLLAGRPAGLDYITSLQGKAQSSDSVIACPGIP